MTGVPSTVTVYWGDGTSDTFPGWPETLTHTYEKPGTYTVRHVIGCGGELDGWGRLRDVLNTDRRGDDEEK